MELFIDNQPGLVGIRPSGPTRQLVLIIYKMLSPNTLTILGHEGMEFPDLEHVNFLSDLISLPDEVLAECDDFLLTPVDYFVDVEGHIVR